MKKTLLVLLVLFMATVAFAFSAGTMNIGGDISYTFSKHGANTLSVNPVFGYLIKPDLSIDIDLEYMNSKSSSVKQRDTGFGGGARYFKDLGAGKLYGGGGLLFVFRKTEIKDYYWGDWDEYKRKFAFVKLKAGYLLPITDHLYLDAGINYKAETKDLDDPLYEARLGLQFFTKSLMPKPRHSSPSYDYDYDYDYDY